MKKIIIVSLLFSCFILFGCNATNNTDNTDRFSFWKGDFSITITQRGLFGNDCVELTGKPFMIYEYDPINGHPLTMTFGLYQYNVSTETIDGCVMTAPLSTVLVDSEYDYVNRLELDGQVTEIYSWVPVETNEEFSFGLGELWYFDAHNSKIYFTFNNVSAAGEITNESGDSESYTTDLNEIIMLHQFNSNTIGN